MSAASAAARPGLDAGRPALHAVRRAGRRRVLLANAGLTLVVLAAVALSLVAGSSRVAPGDVLGALTGDVGGNAAFVVRELRLPRAVTAVLVGVAFGLAGAVFQTVLRNTLASPDVLGITQGASAGAVLCLVLGAGGLVLSAGALGGALGAAALVGLAASGGGRSGTRLILIGIGVAGTLASLTSLVLLRSDIDTAAAALVWLTGSLNGAGWSQAGRAAVGLAVLVPLLAALASRVRTLELDDDTARGLGARPDRDRLLLLAVGTGLAAAATATAGPVAFVAFVSAPLARGLSRAPGLAALPSALTGAAVVLLADLVGRTAFSPTELPVGVFTGIVAGPYLLVLVVRSGRIRL